jgi:predicted RNA binding protein YcfA (HicA-like mRNA interferase family)
MRLPRDLSANQLIKALRVLGYSIDHQRGSHIRIVTQLNGQHHETVPNQGGHLGAHSSEHRQTSQCRCGRSVIATGFVVRFKTMTGAPRLEFASRTIQDGRQKPMCCFNLRPIPYPRSPASLPDAIERFDYLLILIVLGQPNSAGVGFRRSRDRIAWRPIAHFLDGLKDKGLIDSRIARLSQTFLGCLNFPATGGRPGTITVWDRDVRLVFAFIRK